MRFVLSISTISAILLSLATLSGCLKIPIGRLLQPAYPASIDLIREPSNIKSFATGWITSNSTFEEQTHQTLQFFTLNLLGLSPFLHACRFFNSWQLKHASTTSSSKLLLNCEFN